MIAHRHGVVAALVGLLALPRLAPAQQPMQRQVDSLAAEIRVLKGRLDSLRAQLGRAPGVVPAPAGKDTGAANELAALRAAAAAAAGRSDTTKPDTTRQPTRFIGRERNQAQLNPEISVTGDVRAYTQTPGVQRDNFDPREFEVGFQSALDPYSNTKIFLSLENGEVSLEEGYAYWTGLPGHIRFDIGKFRQQFGELNRWHLHALPETEYPLALRTYLGEDGLSGTGISLYRAFGGLGTHEVTAQVTRSASDEALFGGGGRPTYLLHLLNFWQLTGSRRQRHHPAWLVRRHDIQAWPALDCRRPLRLRRRLAPRPHHAPTHPLAHPVGERVGRVARSVQLGQDHRPHGDAAARLPGGLGHRTTQTRDLLTCSDTLRCCSPSTAARRRSRTQ